MNYYKRLNKEDKKKIKEEFLKSEAKTVYKKANKIVVIALIGIIISIIASTFDYIYKTGTINYIIDGLLFIFSLIFFIYMINIKGKEINKYALSKKKK